MKKLFTLSLLVLGLALTGCTEGTENDDNLTELETQVTELSSKLDTQETQITGLETDLETATTDLTAAEELIAELQEQNAALQSGINLTNSKIKNALNRDSWLTRKVKYNADFSSYEAEYCFGIFDEDWTAETASDYTHETGLKFVITVEQIQWGTEVFVKDSCGNYSEFIYENSSFGLYSTPVDFFEVGKTYEVVLYKEVYFTVAQLGLLPVASMGDFGAYPTDLSAIVSTEVE